MAVQGTYTYEWPRPAVTVDVALFDVSGSEACGVLLIKRGEDPYKGLWALPGGFIEMDEELAESAARELWEETGIRMRPEALTEIGAYGGVKRDPRGRTIGVAFAAPVRKADHEARAGDDAAEARWFALDDLPELAFDHDEIIRDSLRKMGLR